MPSRGMNLKNLRTLKSYPVSSWMGGTFTDVVGSSVSAKKASKRASALFFLASSSSSPLVENSMPLAKLPL